MERRECPPCCLEALVSCSFDGVGWFLIPPPCGAWNKGESDELQIYCSS